MSNPDKDTVISFKDVSVVLGDSGNERVVFSLDEFNVSKGQQYALTGPSGCGKTSLLKFAAGLQLPDQGDLLVLGKNLKEMSGSARDTFRGENIGFIYQNHNLLDGFTALENVLIGLRFGRKLAKSEHDSIARDLLKKVGLEKRMNAYPGSMSLGECQRVAIARAISNKPDVLLADEATGSLDPDTSDQVFQLILDICKLSDCTLLFVTHDMKLAESMDSQMDCRKLIHHESKEGKAS